MTTTTGTHAVAGNRPQATAVATAAATAGLLAVAGAATWLVLAAAERPSVLSPPAMRWQTAGLTGGSGWLLGPFHGLLGGLAHDPVRLHRDFAVALVVMFGGWLLAWASAAALPLRVVATATAAVQLLVVLGPPQPLTDVFNYVVYGRMAVHGINPYVHPPVAGIHDTAYALSNWHHLKSPYGPLFTLLFEPLGLLSAPAALWVWKAMVLGFALAALALVAHLARRSGRSPQRAIACVGLCPVALAYGVGGLHNDLPAICCVLGAVACLLRGREADVRGDVACGALAVAAAGIKPSFAVVVPIVVLGAHRRAAAAAGAAAAGAVVLAVVGVVFGGALPALGTQSHLVTPLSIPNLVGVALGHHGADAWVRGLGRDALVAITAAACLATAWRRQVAIPALGAVLVATVFTLSWVMPWYLAWGLPFVALAAPRVLAPLAVATCVWLGVGGSSQLPQLLHHFGYFPTRTTTGRANHEFEKALVN